MPFFIEIHLAGVYGATTRVCGSWGDCQGMPPSWCNLGLKQSPHTWFAKFSWPILNQRLTASEMDPTVFCKNTSDGSVILVMYVDDILLTGREL